jgi:menaquinone-dependent protoporphyrinogen oxidase
MNIAIVYGSNEGQTSNIADFIGDVLEKKGHTVAIWYGKHIAETFSPLKYDAVIVGASIHVGKYQAYMLDFVRKYRDELAQVPNAFFSVCLTEKDAKDSHEDRQQVREYIAEFKQQTGWEPDKVASFAGALLYKEYGFLKRNLVRLIMAQKHAETDTSRNHVYTDWDAVMEFTKSFEESLRQKSAAIN